MGYRRLPHWGYWLVGLVTAGAGIGAANAAILSGGVVVIVGGALGVAAGAVLTGFLAPAGDTTPVRSRRDDRADVSDSALAQF